MARELTKNASKLRAVANAVEKARRKRLPPMPPSLPADMRPDFKVLVATMMDAGTWHEVRMPQVEMLLVNVAAVRAAQEAINRDGAFLMTDTGELKPHPGSVMISKASSSISTASRLLGLNVNSSEPLAKAAKAESALPAEAKRSAWAVKA